MYTRRTRGQNKTRQREEEGEESLTTIDPHSSANQVTRCVECTYSRCKSRTSDDTVHCEINEIKAAEVAAGTSPAKRRRTPNSPQL